ncbi:MAG: hypothetical protein HOZ81_53630, partial [Streptomyces sp.]|nr:hypothetical protein [Streptomyces sp.]
HTSLIGGIIMAVGTLIVIVVLPGREHGADEAARTAQEQTETVDA